MVFGVKLQQRGYKRSIPALYCILVKRGEMADKPANPKYVPKPYQKMRYLGERVQINVKFVPAICLVGETTGKKFYQYTTIDEYSRYRYLEAFEEHSTYSSAQFLEHLIEHFGKLGIKIECVQTDNGTEFTKHLTGAADADVTLFERTLKQRNIRHKLIKPYTPRHNGKVERSHRKDNEYFYAVKTFYSFEGFKKQLAVYLKKYNNFPMFPLGWVSSVQYLKKFKAIQQSFLSSAL